MSAETGEAASERVLPQAVRRPRQFYFEWIPAVLVRPRQTFRQITAEARGVWQAALILLTATTILRVIAAGIAQRALTAGGELALPPGFEYYPPEQQAQFLQAAQVTSGPIFTFVFPGILGLLSVWLGWLVIGGITHLVLTLLGGRGSTIRTMNIVAWAQIPFALRDVVRAIYLFASRSPITSAGLSGLIAPDAAGFALYLAGLLAMLDVYLIWFMVLLITGVRIGDSSLTRGRTIISMIALVLVLMLARAGIAFATGQLTNLSVMRPFFF